MDRLSSVSAGDLRDLITIVALLAAAFAATAIGIWALLRLQAPAALQFDVEMLIMDVGADRDYMAELYFLIHNRGGGAERVRNLFSDVRQAGNPGGLLRQYVDGQDLIPPKTPAPVVRPGTRLMLSRSFAISRQDKAVRVSAVLNAANTRVILDGLQDLTTRNPKVFGQSALHVTRLFPVSPRDPALAATIG